MWSEFKKRLRVNRLGREFLSASMDRRSMALSIESLEDRVMLATFVVGNTGVANATANSGTASDAVHVGIPGPATHTIAASTNQTVRGATAKVAAIEATKDDSLFADNDGDGNVDPGDTVHYEVWINNGGDGDASDVVFTDTLDPNTTLVPGSINVSPLAFDDIYFSDEGFRFEGFNLIADGGGSLNITDASLGLFANDVEFLGDTFTLDSFDTSSAAGGAVSVNPNGTFTYDPPTPGFDGLDTFTYTIIDGAGLSDTGTATIDLRPTVLTINGQPISFGHVNDSNIGGDGSFENPFGSLTEADLDPNKPNRDVIYVESGTTFNSQFFELAPNQRVLGQGDSNAQFVDTDQLGTIELPTIGSFTAARPQVTALDGFFAFNANLNTQISNFNINNRGVGNRGGIFTGPRNVNVDRTLINGGATGIDITNPTGSLTFDEVTITNPTDTGLQINGGNGGMIVVDNSRIRTGNGGTAVKVTGGHDGIVILNPGTSIMATTGDGLQFDDADGQYDFRGQVTLNGGDAGIDIIGGSAGTFTFTNTDIHYSGSNEAVNVDSHSGGTITFDSGSTINVTNGDGLQFDDADGQYDFRGQVTLNGGDAGIDIIGGSVGTFTFTNTDIDYNGSNEALNVDNNRRGTITFGPGSSIDATNGTGLRFNNADSQYDFQIPVTLNGGDAGIDIIGGSTGTFTFSNTDIHYNGSNEAVNIDTHSGGTITFDTGSTINATDGTGLQFDDADAQYDFRGQVQLNGGDAGIDIIGGSAGTFTFSDATTVTNPTGAGLAIRDLDAGGTVNYHGSIENNNNVFLDIERTAPGSHINFLTNGTNSLTSTDNPFGAIFIFDADGDITITTPVTVVRPLFSSLFTTDGDGIWSFTDMTITDQMGLNGAIDVFAQNGTVNFTNLNITTDSAGTGDATTAFLAGGNNIMNVMGNSNIDADGGGAIVLINIEEINMTFDNVTSTNNLTSQIGFAGDDGIDLLSVRSGSLDITGMTTIQNVDGVGVSLEAVGADVTLELIDIDTTGFDAIIAAVVEENTGLLTVNGGTISNIGGDGFRVGSTAGGGTGGFLDLNDTTFSNIGLVVGRVANSTFSGTGNIAVPFSCVDDGGNTGFVSFNGGADTCPAGAPLQFSPQLRGAEGYRSDADQLSERMELVLNRIRTARDEVAAREAVTVSESQASSADAESLAQPPSATGSDSAAIPGNAVESESTANNHTMFGFLGGGENRMPSFGQAEGAIADSASPIAFIGSPIDIGTLPVGKSVTITFQATVNSPFPSGVTSVANQGTVSGSNFADVLTDDPATNEAGDATITEIDTAPPTVTLSVDKNSISEAGGEAIVTATLSQSSSEDVTVNLGFGGSAQNSADYARSAAQIVIKSGALRGSIKLNAKEDSLVEGKEQIVVDIVSVINANEAGRQRETVTIRDKDVAMLGIQSSAQVREHGGAQPVFVTLRTSNGNGGTATLAPGVTLSVDVVDTNMGTATLGTDYLRPGTQTFTFGPGSGNGDRQSVHLTPKNDSLVEGNETVTLRLQNLQTSENLKAGLGNDSNTTHIVDNDRAVLGIQKSLNVREHRGEQQIFVTLRTSDGKGGTATLAPGVTLTADVVDTNKGTAKSGLDYDPVSTQAVTFGPGSGNGARRSVDLTPVNDSLVEGNETVNLRLRNLASPVSVKANLGNKLNTTTIRDNDLAVLGIQSSAKIFEHKGRQSVFVTLRTSDGNGGRATLAPGITLRADVVDTNMGTATRGVDYATFGKQTVTFGPGSGNGARQRVQLTPVNDSMVEGNETINLKLQNLRSPVGAKSSLGNSRNTTTVRDNDLAVLGIQSFTPVFEQRGSQSVFVTLRTSNGRGGRATLAPGITLRAEVVDTRMGTATSGVDYEPFGKQFVTFAPGSRNGDRQSVQLTPKNDSLVERNETVNLRLQNLQAPMSVKASLGNTRNTTTIVDNDRVNGVPSPFF